jgi:hypothetical protein
MSLERRSLVKAALLAPWALAGCQAKPEITGGFVGSSPERGHVLRQARGSATHRITRTVHTLIAGGGVAGLSAARALRLQGMQDFALLELEDETGGNARAGSTAGMAHPLGAHYLPVPSDAAPETQDFLEELGLRQRVAGRWQYDERHLCHSPQERLYFNGAWQDGLLPIAGVGQDTLAQYALFAKLVSQWRATGGFQIPTPNTAVSQSNKAQLAMPFAAYLAAQGLNDVHLRWYLDYCCRDDYGAGIDVVSAWAGIHYFASRHGFAAPGNARAETDAEKHAAGVLTWPEGNGYLTAALAKPLSDRLFAGRVVLRIAEEKSGVVIDALNVQSQTVERWQAQRCIVALPVFIAARVVQNAPDFLRHTAQHTTTSSWLVANVHINAALQDTAGAAAAWDNVIYNPPTTGVVQTGLGYVDAMHQSTRTAPGPSVLTYYRALGVGLQERRDLLSKSWQQHRDETLADLAVAHPDIELRAVQVNITRYGHAMAVPTADFAGQKGMYHPDFRPLALPNKNRKYFSYAPRSTPQTERLRFAHSDWSGYSVFEEAFTRGLHSAMS